MLQCESSWTWWELLMKFFHDCNIAVTQIGCCESKLTPKWFSFCERMPVEAQACSNLLIFMLQQSATRVSQLKTVARLRRRRRRKSATLWGMMEGWKSITLTLQIQNNSAVFWAAESFKIVATSCHLLSGMKLIYLCIPPHHSCVLLCMATLFVWYNGKVLHTWHYNWLAGVCFLNNNPPPARALRNVITINLNGADQSWGGVHVRHDARRHPQCCHQHNDTDVQHSEFGWYCLTGREHEWNPYWSVITINAVVHLVSGSGPVYVGLNQVWGPWWRHMVTIMWLNLNG